jgi:hypothetical protein
MVKNSGNGFSLIEASGVPLCTMPGPRGSSGCYRKISSLCDAAMMD